MSSKDQHEQSAAGAGASTTILGIWRRWCKKNPSSRDAPASAGASLLGTPPVEPSLHFTTGFVLPTTLTTFPPISLEEAG
jgi:hypothetical protein